MQASLQMTVFFDLCIGRSPFSEMEPQRGGIELKARQIGRRENPVRQAEKTVMQASLQMTVFFDLCIGRSPFSEKEPQRGGIELKARQIGRRENPVLKFLNEQKIYDKVYSSQTAGISPFHCRQINLVVLA